MPLTGRHTGLAKPQRDVLLASRCQNGIGPAEAMACPKKQADVKSNK